MLRSSLWLFIVSLAFLVQPLHAQTPAGGVPVKTYTGYFNNTAVYFTAFETSSLPFAQVNGLIYAPRLSLANRAVVPQMLFFPNAAAPQSVVLQTQPGQAGYNPIWDVLVASWRGVGKMPLITSYAAAVQYNRQGLLTVQRPGILFNGPVIWINMNLNRQGGQRAPTISPNEFLGINPAARTAYFRSHQGYFNGQLTAFLALEHAAGVIQLAPGAIPVPTIQTNTIGHNAIANFYVVQGQQLPVIDTFPQSTTTVTNPTTPGYSIQGKPVVSPDAGQKPVGGVQGQQPVSPTPIPTPYPVAQGQPVGGVQGQQPVGGVQGQQPYPVSQGQPVGGVQGGQPVGGVQGQQPVGGVQGQQPVPVGTGQPVGGYLGQQPVGGVQGQQPVGGVQGQQPYPVGTGQPVGGSFGQNPVGGQIGQQPGQTTYPPVSPGSGQPSYASLYSPLWHIHYVTWRPGVTPRLLRSLQEIQQAANLGHVTVQDGGAAEVFNCPIITAAQPYNPVSPGTGFDQGGSPVYPSPQPPVGGTPVTPTPPPGYY